MTSRASLVTEARPPDHVHGIADVGPHIPSILAQAVRLKRLAAKGRLPRLLQGKAFVLLFDRPSTRTRVSFELGIQRLGGMVSTLEAASSQLSRGESPHDTGLVLGRYADGIVYRAVSDDAFRALAAASRVPVVNALTPSEHPCQILADLMALQEEWGTLAGRTVTFIGDGNNVCHSWLLAAPLVGMHVRVAAPQGYGPAAAVVADARRSAAVAGTTVAVGTDARAAATGADVIVTDTWTSMGDGAERAAREAAFAGFQVDDALMAVAAPGAVFLHCLPGHWGREATESVAHGPRSRVVRAAEDRMWVQMALLAHLVGRLPSSSLAP